MRIDGEWFSGDGVPRPVIRAQVVAADGSWVPARFLLDTGADRTILSAKLLATLGLSSAPYSGEFEGVGGMTQAVVVNTQIRLQLDLGGRALFRGAFMARTDPAVLELNLLGRDITDLFAVIVDRPGNLVCLLSQRHLYRIESLDS